MIWDVAIAGAGPGGATLAALLAARGFHVLVCERARFPREKLCGDFLSPDGVRVLESRGLLDSLESPSIHDVVLSAPWGSPLRRALPARGLGVSRASFDTRLAAAATERGAQVRFAHRVRSVTRGDEVFTVTGTSDTDGHWSEITRAAVDATGLVGLEPTRRAARGGLVAFQRHYRPRANRTDENAVELHAFTGGYCGLNPIDGGHVNACFIGPSSSLRAGGGRPETWLDLAALQNPTLADRLAALEPVEERFRSVANLGFRAPPPSREGLLRVGDASGQVAPLSGEGMAMALRSAVLAEAALVPFLDERRSWRASLAVYEQSCTREFSGQLRLCRALHGMLSRPLAAAALIGAGRLLPGLVDSLVRATRDWDRPRELASPSR